MPAVSVIVPLYNRETLVKETLDSVVAQTFEDWECIIVDDHSTDQSLQVAQAYAGRDPRFKVFQRESPNKGANACRNEGFAASSGEYVLFLDSDDLLMPHCLEGRLDTLGGSADWQFCVVSGLIFEKDPSAPVGQFRRARSLQCDLDRFLVKLIPWQTSGPLWRRDALCNVGKWNERLLSWQDSEYHIRALLQQPDYEYSEVPDYGVRRTQGESIGSSRHTPEKLLAHETVLENLVYSLSSNSEHQSRYPLLAVRHWDTVRRWITLSNTEAQRLWRITHERGLVGRQAFALGRRYLNLAKLPRVGTHVRRKVLPSFAKTHRLVPDCWAD